MAKRKRGRPRKSTKKTTKYVSKKKYYKSTIKRKHLPNKTIKIDNPKPHKDIIIKLG